MDWPPPHHVRIGNFESGDEQTEPTEPTEPTDAGRGHRGIATGGAEAKIIPLHSSWRFQYYVLYVRIKYESSLVYVNRIKSEVSI